MFKRKIGDRRKFERYTGEWEVIGIMENKNLQCDLMLSKQKCPSCGAIIGRLQKYIFNYIEELQNKDKILHLGVSDCGRYVILEEYGVEVNYVNELSRVS